MQVTLELPDDIQSLPPEQQREKVMRAFQVVVKMEKSAPHSRSKQSKWAKIVQRVEDDPVHLAGYSEQLKKDMKEFRNNFDFKHDQ